MTKVVAPTIANLMSSWCRSKYGRIGRGSRAIVASVKDTTSECTETTAFTRTRAGQAQRGRDTMKAVPTPKVTMIGGGQLARMTHQSAIALGQTLRVLAVTPDDPAAQVTPDVVIGSHDNLDDLRRAAAGANVVTFDHEHVPIELLEKLRAEGATVAPPPEALVHAQDKLVMRRRLDALGAPVPRYAAVTELADI